MSTPTRSPHEAVAEEARALLARRRISGRAAARGLGWKTDYMWRRLDGRTPFDVNDLVALARLLGVPVTTLIAPLESD
ncbi:helix-turn-helix transcriptional regulator, partial [Actinomadura nitritigenes]